MICAALMQQSAVYTFSFLLCNLCNQLQLRQFYAPVSGLMISVSSQLIFIKCSNLCIFLCELVRVSSVKVKKQQSQTQALEVESRCWTNVQKSINHVCIIAIWVSFHLVLQNCKSCKYMKTYVLINLILCGTFLYTNHFSSPTPGVPFRGGGGLL